ncbi:hydroxyisourate hydrolase [Rhodobacteraceae bacterium RKSG542]|uniref:hydroxyisourate hydrolase n=1 Tax=Pseudovibrio flavus TaxID=2529854 RepID=UPI0012BB553C|nr:hydroxyisourate hydrolase [Pseudovibrio flavus]MTI17542.1 hydroxyisourate hydrolase [Pseudovibrio flavus]
MGALTTHVLDTARGIPAAKLAIDLYRLDGEQRVLLGKYTTNSDGRVDAPLMQGDDFALGTYELVFHAGDYLLETAQAGARPLFLDVIPLRFSISDVQSHYHVPLLLSPFGYSTYRGS